MLNKAILTIAGVFALANPVIAQSTDTPFNGFDIAVDADGKIVLPKEPFRDQWTSLGTFITNGDEGEPAKGIHNVYTQPGVVEAYKKDGKFPDGTVLVKELLTTKTEDLTTGHISYAGDVEGWFVMIKDTNNRYADNPLWGDGWGWGFFQADAPDTLATEDYEAECRACHEPAQDTDWIYIRGYPSLR